MSASLRLLTYLDYIYIWREFSLNWLQRLADDMHHNVLAAKFNFLLSFDREGSVTTNDSNRHQACRFFIKCSYHGNSRLTSSVKHIKIRWREIQKKNDRTALGRYFACWHTCETEEGVNRRWHCTEECDSSCSCGDTVEAGSGWQKGDQQFKEKTASSL